MARTVRQIRKKGKRHSMAPSALVVVAEDDARVALTKLTPWLPVWPEAFYAELQRELVSLFGERHVRTGRQPGLVR